MSSPFVFTVSPTRRRRLLQEIRKGLRGEVAHISLSPGCGWSPAGGKHRTLAVGRRYCRNDTVCHAFGSTVLPWESGNNPALASGLTSAIGGDSGASTTLNASETFDHFSSMTSSSLSLTSETASVTSSKCLRGGRLMLDESVDSLRGDSEGVVPPQLSDLLLQLLLKLFDSTHLSSLLGSDAETTLWEESPFPGSPLIPAPVVPLGRYRLHQGSKRRNDLHRGWRLNRGPDQVLDHVVQSEARELDRCLIRVR
ncbi:hypothetical protein EYF80_045007 [Liparis tanakae]|uniref:Uncharacterized protein n=1 Tax=Liparis tanakae TaxID=230148 RepID=A0A4Z2FVA9_9TELE|nr:hypothetical protein EYF80_045007 [Liparis tanakae]